MFNRQTNEMEYRDGATNCNLLLADEINRTSPKTQAALLEAMEEKSVTVDGKNSSAAKSVYLHCDRKSAWNNRNTGITGISDGSFYGTPFDWISID